MQNKAAGNPFASLLQALRKPVGPPPKKLPPYKFYMQHSEFSPAIAQEVEKRWPSSGLERSHLLNFRCKVAQELFEGESDEVRRRMEEECIKSHREAVDAYNSAGSGGALV